MFVSAIAALRYYVDYSLSEGGMEKETKKRGENNGMVHPVHSIYLHPCISISHNISLPVS